MKKLSHSHTDIVMETVTKPGIFRNLFVKALIFCVFIVCFRFAYVVTIRGESCDVGDFCFFSLPETLNFISAAAAGGGGVSAASSAAEVAGDPFYSSVFQDLISEGFLSPQSKSLIVNSFAGKDVLALRELEVSDVVGLSDKKKKTFNDDVFDFVFSAGIDGAKNLTKLAGEIGRMMKPEGYLVVHTKSNDTYSLHSFIALFNCCTFIKSREIQGLDGSKPYIREIVMKKEHFNGVFVVNNNNECFVPGYKQEIVRKAEPLIKEEPLKPWITLKRNIQNIKYLPSMVDISFNNRYIYVDVGARSYGSSIGSWFRKQYPKQNKTFEVYAIEADKSFHDEYSAKKKWVKLLPYAAWVRNETLFFEVNHDPGDDPEEKGKKGRGMGRIKPVQSDNERVSNGVDKIVGFDFAEWLKSTVTEKDFVVMKMDVEGTEFDLIPRLFETGAICLIDEIFLECHYNRWQRCCPGERSAKYEKTYGQCLELFTSLRDRGVLVHQWW